MMQRASHVEQSSLSWLDLPDHNNIIIIIIVIVFLGTGTINVMCVAMTDFDIHQPVYRIKKKKKGGLWEAINYWLKFFISLVLILIGATHHYGDSDSKKGGVS